MEERDFKIKLKELAVVLYEEFKGDQNAIMKELLENNLKLTPPQIEEKVKDYNIEDYVIMGEDDYADILQDIESNSDVVYIYKKVVKH